MTAGIPARIPRSEEEQLRSRTSEKSPGARRLLEAPRAMRIPSCLDFLRKNREEAYMVKIRQPARASTKIIYIWRRLSPPSGKIFWTVEENMMAE